MRAPLRLASILVLAAFGLAACNDDDDDNNTSERPQDQFGSTFSAAFAADENDDPIDPDDGDAGDLSLTGDPIDF